MSETRMQQSQSRRKRRILATSLGAPVLMCALSLCRGAMALSPLQASRPLSHGLSPGVSMPMQKMKSYHKPRGVSRKWSRLTMSSVDKVGSLFEDVDGIGESTTGIDLTTTIDPTTGNIELDILNDVQSTASAPPEIPEIDIKIVPMPQDVSEVEASIPLVQEIIASALSDPDVNGAIPAEPLKQEIEAQRQQAIEEDQEVIEAPRLSKIIKFAIPAVGVWLCSPLLSLIDTSSVGLLSGTAQQAALNPAVAVTDYSALLVAFMYTATTNLVASAGAKEKDLAEKPQTKDTLVRAIQLSGFVGLFLGTVLSTLAPILVKAIIGNDTIDPEVFAAALRYVRIRALGFPAAVIIGSAQSACLGLQDIKSPMYVLLAAAIVNFIGDMIFVPNTNAWIGGAAGAAWATVFSQYAALGMFLKWLRSKPKPKSVNLTKAILELTGKSSEGKPRRTKFRKNLQKLSGGQGQDQDAELDAHVSSTARPRPFSKFFKQRKNGASNTNGSDGSFSVKGFLSGSIRSRDLLTFPPLEEAKKFWPYVIPVTTTSFGRVSAYVAMSHVVSSSLGTLSMAANQVVLSVFYCLTPVADSLSLTAQSFLPGIYQEEWGSARAGALKEATYNFMKAGAIFGSFCASVVGFVPLFSKLFTSDPLVISQVHSVLPILAGVFSMHGLICAGEGLLLGQKDLNFLGKAYSSFFFAVPYFMLRLKKFALNGTKAIGLTSCWEVFMYYQFVRLAIFATRVKVLINNAKKQTVKV